MKHCQEALPQMVTGSLLGLNVGNGILEITHAFPFPDSNKSDLVVKGGGEKMAMPKMTLPNSPATSSNSR